MSPLLASENHRLLSVRKQKTVAARGSTNSPNIDRKYFEVSPRFRARSTALRYWQLMPLAQLVEQLTVNQRVRSSSLRRPTKFFHRGIANRLFILALKIIAWRL